MAGYMENICLIIKNEQKFIFNFKIQSTATNYMSYVVFDLYFEYEHLSTTNRNHVYVMRVSTRVIFKCFLCTT